MGRGAGLARVGPDAGLASMSAAAAIRASSVDDVIAAVRDAGAHATPLRVAGAGHWLDAGHPVAADATTLDVSAIRGIVEYTPGDLTLTARAGTTLAELDRATAKHGQWCPLQPWGSDDGTLGATFATATAGPCSAALGLPRDLALGVEFVDGRGELVRGGGRVVKNVAGFDLTRLLVGSWGSLGVITEVSMRLRARAAVDETWVVAIDALDERTLGRIDALRAGDAAPLALELVNAALAAHLGLPAGIHLLARIGGNAAFVAAARVDVAAVGPATAHDPSLWQRLRAAEPPGGVTIRASTRQSQWTELAEWMATGGGRGNGASPTAMIHLSIARAVLRLIAPAAGRDDGFAIAVPAPNRIQERPAMHDWRGSDPTGTFRSTAAVALAARVHLAFDPHHILNPGILG